MKSKTKIKVQNYHTDQQKHVNHIRYLEFLEEGRMDFFEMSDLKEKIHETSDSAHVMSQINLKYRGSASMGDLIVVETEIKDFTRVRLILNQKIINNRNDRVILEAESVCAFIDLNTGRVAAVNKEIAEHLSGIMGS